MQGTKQSCGVARCSPLVGSVQVFCIIAVALDYRILRSCCLVCVGGGAHCTLQATKGTITLTYREIEGREREGSFSVSGDRDR